jgi:hypothetical protein
MNVLSSRIVITGGPTLIFTGMIDLAIGSARPLSVRLHGTRHVVRDG